MQKSYDVTGVGNAIVDVQAFVEDMFLVKHALPKGAMSLIDETIAEKLYQNMKNSRECSGGSAANTIAGLASLGGKGAFIGKVFSDQLGKIFRHDLESNGIYYPTVPATTGKPTARSFIMVTPDGQRTMNTYLGASTKLSVDDIDEQLIAQSKILYIEGYLWDDAESKKAIKKAIDIAKGSETSVSFTLSDSFCVERHRNDFLELDEKYVDILFANEAEAKSLFLTDSIDIAIEKFKSRNRITAITRSELGSVIISEDRHVIKAPAHPIHKLVDTTGAGDLFASGFLYGVTQGKPLEECARIASIAASEVIQHLGARPEKPLASLGTVS